MLPALSRPIVSERTRHPDGKPSSHPPPCIGPDISPSRASYRHRTPMSHRGTLNDDFDVSAAGPSDVIRLLARVMSRPSQERSDRASASATWYQCHLLALPLPTMLLLSTSAAATSAAVRPQVEPSSPPRFRGRRRFDRAAATFLLELRTPGHEADRGYGAQACGESIDPHEPSAARQLVRAAEGIWFTVPTLQSPWSVTTSVPTDSTRQFAHYTRAS